MIFEILLMIALVMLALYAYVKVTSTEQERLDQAYYYEDLIDQILDSGKGSSEHTSRLWRELDTRRMEVSGLKQINDGLQEENQRLRDQLSEYWVSTN